MREFRDGTDYYNCMKQYPTTGNYYSYQRPQHTFENCWFHKNYNNGFHKFENFDRRYNTGHCYYNRDETSPYQIQGQQWRQDKRKPNFQFQVRREEKERFPHRNITIQNVNCHSSFDDGVHFTDLNKNSFSSLNYRDKRIRERCSINNLFGIISRLSGRIDDLKTEVRRLREGLHGKDFTPTVNPPISEMTENIIVSTISVEDKKESIEESSPFILSTTESIPLSSFTPISEEQNNDSPLNNSNELVNLEQNCPSTSITEPSIISHTEVNEVQQTQQIKKKKHRNKKKKVQNIETSIEPTENIISASIKVQDIDSKENFKPYIEQTQQKENPLSQSKSEPHFSIPTKSPPVVGDKRLLVKNIGVSELQIQQYKQVNIICAVNVDEPPREYFTKMTTYTENPFWNQSFVFNITHNTKEVTFEVFNESEVGSIYLGQCIVSINDLNKDSSHVKDLKLVNQYDNSRDNFGLLNATVIILDSL